MSAKFFTPNDTPTDILNIWEDSLPSPKSILGGSTRALAKCWANARGFPSEVQKLFNQSSVPALEKLKFERGYPVYAVKLEGKGTKPRIDIFVCASGTDGQVCIAVEGKKMPSEDFEEPVQDWRNIKPGPNREKRLCGLLKETDLDMAKAQTLRYQLLHRAASPLIEAKKKPGCKTAVMLVHAFGLMRDNFRDFEKFAKAMDVKGKVHENRIYYAKTIGGINLYLGWING